MSTKGRWGPKVPFQAGAAIVRQRLVALGTEDGVVVQAGGSAEALFGISDRPAIAGGVVDVCVCGVVAVEYGGAVSRGDLLTSDANGKAVEADSVAAASGSETQFAVASGAPANADIVVAGIVTMDELLSVIEVDGDSTVDRTAVMSIDSDGNLRGSAATTGKKLLVAWRSPATPVAAIGRALVAGVDGDIGSVLVVPHIV